jgi:hypothetical protein
MSANRFAISLLLKPETTADVISIWRGVAEALWEGDSSPRRQGLAGHDAADAVDQDVRWRGLEHDARGAEPQYLRRSRCSR